MRRLVIVFIIVQFSVINAFADGYDDYKIQNTIYTIINESIEWQYIRGYSVRIVPREPITINSQDEIFITIHFKAGVYELRDYFNNIIENKLLIELNKEFQNYDIYISTKYPFSVILTNNINYEFDERQNIIDRIIENTHGITVEDIFQNSIYGYVQDRYFTNTQRIGSQIINESLYNNIFPFLDNIYRFFGGENIIKY
jgi:hypothetical protein